MTVYVMMSDVWQMTGVGGVDSDFEFTLERVMLHACMMNHTLPYICLNGSEGRS